MALLFNRSNGKTQSSVFLMQEVELSLNPLVPEAGSMARASLIGQGTPGKPGQRLLPQYNWKHEYCHYFWD